MESGNGFTLAKGGRKGETGNDDETWFCSASLQQNDSGSVNIPLPLMLIWG